MKTRMRQLILPISGMLFFTVGIASAKLPSLHHSSQRSADIDLIQTTKIPSGPTLKAGSYKVTLVNESGTPELEFYQDGKSVGEAPVKLVDQDKKISQTEVFADTKDDHTQVVTEMDLSGWTQKVVFSGSDASSGSGE